MSSWCQNKITITNKIQAVLDILKAEVNLMLFCRFIPDVKKNNFSQIYGTNWDVPMNKVDYINESNEKLYIIFNTISTPCINFCKRISRIFSLQLTLEYDNFCENFCGKLIFDEKTLISEDYYTYWYGMYKLNNDYFWENLTPEIFDEIKLNNDIPSIDLNKIYFMLN